MSSFIYTFFFITLFLLPNHFSLYQRTKLIVWDVGQGQLVTFSTSKTCYHFDAGGEFLPTKSIKKECFHKANHLFLSHWDYDHIGLSLKLKYALKNLCLIEGPGGGTSSKKKKRIINRLPRCSDKSSKVQIIHDGSTPRRYATKSNYRSKVYTIEGILIPGDSPSRMEKIWSTHVSSEIKILILGHHGSQTSTSKHLLNQLKHLRLAFASSRRSRYGHPHPKVKERLNHIFVPVVATSEWGTLKIIY